jgi:serine phosphatase RsbU (regulator of sigma subunit)
MPDSLRALSFLVGDHVLIYQLKLIELNDHIYENLLEFTRGTKQSDDITYLLVRVRNAAV